MKSVSPFIILVFILFISSCSIKGHVTPKSSFYGSNINDTITYLKKEIIENKDKFVNHEFAKLIASMTLEPRSFMISTNILNAKRPHTIYLIFYSFQESLNRADNRRPNPYLVVRFKEPFDTNELLSLRGRYSTFWTKAETDFFSHKIIEDVELFY